VIVAALGAQPRPGRSLTESVCDYLSAKQALIILDNCEHLLDAAAGMAEAILRAAPGVRVLATSREPLGVNGERLLGVPSLSVASASESSLEAIAACEAVQLFMDRAHAARSSVQLDASNVEPIVEICRRLDAIPLAIELAAARVTSMGPGEIAGLLDERFRLLTGGRRRGVERHHTLRATVEWSYALLNQRERVIFDRLGVFAGSFDTDAATAVAGDDEFTAWDVRDALDDLAAKSMIVVDDRLQASTRFRLLETLRQYALERLDDTGHTEEHRRRHAEHYATFAEAAGPALEGPAEGVWVGRLDTELDNLRAAVAWALDAEAPTDAEFGLRIIAALASQSMNRPKIGVGEWAETALGRVEATTPGRRCAVLAVAAAKARNDGKHDLLRSRAAAALRDGLPPDTPSPALAYVTLATGDALAGAQQAALQTLIAGHRALDAIGANDFNHLVLDFTGQIVLVLSGEHEDARGPAEEDLQRAHTFANPSALIMALFFFGETRRSDESSDAIQALEECVARARTVATADSAFALLALGSLAKLRARRGEHTPAIEALREALVRAHDTGQPVVLATILNHGIGVAADLNALEFAATLGAAATDGPLAWLINVGPALLIQRQAALDQVRARLDPERYHAAVARGTATSYEQIVEYTLAELDRLLAETNNDG
jgi:predicted ATPase